MVGGHHGMRHFGIRKVENHCLSQCSRTSWSFPDGGSGQSRREELEELAAELGAQCV